MRFLIFILLTPLLLAAAPIKVAIIGDSISFGSGAEQRELNRYSTRLGHLLGDTHEVKPFAASSLCLLRKADRPFIKTLHFQKALAFKPDIAVITLGTNDTCQNAKRNNWQHHADLQADALFLVTELRKANPNIVVHLCSPPPMFPHQKGLKPGRKADLLERSKHLPVIHKAYAAAAATDDKLHFHDLSRALTAGRTTDGVHPDTFGHEQLAHHYHELLAQPTGTRADFSGTSRSKAVWNGFERHDFQLSETKAKAILVIPHTAAKGEPWIWRTRFWGHQPALDLALLDRGYHLAYVDVGNLYGCEAAMKRGEELHQYLTTQFKLSQKPILEGMSRGGLFIFNFAAKHPDKVTAIYGDNPVCNFNSWPGGMNGKLSKGDYARCLAAYGITAEQAKTHPQITSPAFAEKLEGIPVALVIGTADEVVPPSENAELVAANLAMLNSPLKVWRKPGLGHHPHGLSPVAPLLRFLLRADGRDASPASHPKPSSEYRSGAGWGGTWWQAFDHLKSQAKAYPETKVIFLGDSISQGLTGHKDRRMTKWLPEHKALSLGLSGDRSEHVLYRLQNGLLGDLKPTHLVLMIGVNNIGAGHTGEETAAGTKSIVAWLKINLPETKVLLLGSFPRGKFPGTPARADIAALHQGIKPLADNKTVSYRNLRPLFLNKDGTQNDRMSGDGVHITSKGQKAWIDAIRDFLN